MRVRIMSLMSGVALALVMVVPAFAHPRVPDQSVCVLPAAAASGVHTAAFGPAGDQVAGHVLWVRSAHYCAD